MTASLAAGMGTGLTAVLAALGIFLIYYWAVRAIQRQRRRRQRAEWMQTLARYARRDKAIEAARARNAGERPGVPRRSER